MYKSGMWLRFFLMVAAFSFFGSGSAWAQSSEPAFRVPEWRVIAQYFDDGANRAYYAGTPGNLPLFATAEEACEAGANYVLPRLGEYSDNLSPGFQPGMVPSGVRPFGDIDYILNGNLYRSTKGRKCSVDGWERGSSGVSEYDIFEGGQRITTVETLESGSGNIAYLFRKVWVGSIAAIPDCNNDGTLYVLDDEPTCVSGGSSQYRNAPDCEGAEGDSPKSTPPKKCAGNPIALDSGAKQQQDLDYATADGLLGVARKYRSNVRPTNLSSTLTEIPGFGTHWRGLTPGRLTIHGSTGFWNAEFLNDEGGTRRFGISADEAGLLAFDTLPTRTRLKLATVQPFSGSIEAFVSVAADPNGAADLRMSYSNGDYILFRAAGSLDPQTKTRHYVPVEHGLANGYRRWFDYPDGGQHFSQVRDSLGRQIGVQWIETGWASTRLRGYYKAPGQPSAPPEMTLEKAIGSITLPDGTSLAYGYGASTPSGFLGRLETARRLDASQNVLWARTYLYEDTRFPAALTGTLDQNGARLSTYAYDDVGNATLTERAGGFDRQQIVYSQGPESPENYGQPLDIRDVTNPLGLTTRYTYSAFSENYSGGESPGPDPRFTPRRLLKTQSPATLLTAERAQFFEYDEDGLQIARTDANGGRMAQENIPGEGRPSFSTDATGVETQIEWHPTLDLPIRQTRKNLITDYVYSASGQLTGINRTDTQSGASRTIAMTYGAAGRVETVNGPRQPDAEGRDDETVMTYDAQGNLLTMANALGHLTRYEGYDPNGRPARVIDANGVATEITYDGLGRIKTTSVKHPVDVASDAVTTFDYDIEGRVTAVTRPETATLRFDYNLAGLMVAMRSDDGERVDYSHDPMGNVVSETVRRSDGTQARAIGRTFDELGRLLTMTLGPDRTTRFQYDKVGNPTRITSARGNAVDQAFDPLNRLVSTLAPDGGKSSYGYAGGLLGATGGGTADEPIVSGDGDGPINELGAFRDPNGVTTRFVRNAFGQVTEEVSPDRGTIRYEYDAAGDLAATIDGRGQRIVYVRDILGRVVSKTPVGRPASEQVAYIYDLPLVGGSYAIGRLSRINDGSGATRFGYDHRGNLTTRFQKLAGTPDWVALRYRFDLADRIDLITYPSGRQVIYVRDAKGRIASVRTRAAVTVPTWTTISSGMSYEAFGSLKAISLGNGERMVASYGDDGRLDSRRLYKTSDGANVSHLTYGYDADDNMVRITDRLNADNTLTYAYDEVGRLKRVTTATGELRRTDYVYDANGNKTREFRRPLPDDPASAATIDRYTFETGSNRLKRVTTAAGNRTLTYDARGNLAGEIRPGGVTVNTAYDGYGRLTGYRRSGEVDLTHVYNGMDDRVATTTMPSSGAADTRRFVYAPDGRVLGEYGANASDVRAEFIWMSPEAGEAANDNSPFGGGDGLGGYMPLAVAMADPVSGTGATQLIWVHASHMGVPICYSDASGTTLDPPTSYSVPGFPGQSRTTADLYYNRYRDYDPTTGRYIQADPIGLAGGPEPYGYAMNNPLRYTDSQGLFLDTLADIGFIGYDLYRLGRDNILGDCDNLGENLTALGLDLGATFVPFVTGAGAASRVVGHADEIAEVTANRLRGNAARDDLADLLSAVGRDVTTDKHFWTPFGSRFVDIDVWHNGARMGGIEVKTGRSRYLPHQRAKDFWLEMVLNYKVQLVRLP